MMRKTTILSAIVAMLLTGPALAGAGCDAVLQARAFNTTDIDNVLQVYSTVSDEMCQTEWSDSGSFSAKASSLGIDVSIAKYAFGLNNANNNEQSAYSTAYENVCKKYAGDYRSYRRDQTGVVDATYAVKAWENCTLSTKGLYATITEAENHNYFNVLLTNSTDAGEYDLTGIVAGGGDVACVDDDSHDLSPTVEKPRRVVGRYFNFGCSKPATDAAVLSFNSSLGGAPIASKVKSSNLTIADAERLEREAATLATQVATLTQQLQSSSDQVAALKVNDRFVVETGPWLINPENGQYAETIACSDAAHPNGKVVTNQYGALAGFVPDPGRGGHQDIELYNAIVNAEGTSVDLHFNNEAGSPNGAGSATAFIVCEGQMQ